MGVLGALRMAVLGLQEAWEAGEQAHAGQISRQADSHAAAQRTAARPAAGTDPLWRGVLDLQEAREVGEQANTGQLSAGM